METIDTPKIDKSTWGPGEWQDEPDREDWVAHGLACMIRRHEQHGHWCGYVGVPREHALYGNTLDKIHTLQVHGGVTWTSICSPPICHVPQEGMPADVWWIGFDCGHTWDKSPGRDARLREAVDANRERGNEEAAALFERTLNPWRQETYRNIYYVRAQVEQLAAQLAGVGPTKRRKKARA